ncbi:MAG: ROK family protein [Planctomycetes bacterium]|nr:ROK family protein [Planctomycetota bacterium]
MVQAANRHIKVGNRRLVLNLFRNSGPLDVSRLAAATDLSKMTIHKVVDYYLEQGVIEAAGKGEAWGEVGKKPNLFRLNAEYRHIFSAQIFETSLVAAVTDLNARILRQKRIPYDKDTAIGEILDQARVAFDEMCRDLKSAAKNFAAVVLGTNGVTDSQAGVILTSPHFSSWGSLVPVLELLRERFPLGIPLHVDNWIRHQAYAEMKIGAARNLRRFMVIGTEPDGISSGLVWDGNPVHGRKGLAGEIGHMQVDLNTDVVCACGGVGCLEPAVSLIRMQDRARSLAGEFPDSRLFATAQPDTVTYQDIFRAADAGDDLSRRLLDDAAKFMAMAINNIVQVCDPELIIIQGEYAGAGDYFLQRLNERVRRISLVNMDKGIQIIYSQLGQQGVIGAAYFAADQFFAHMD